MHLSRLLSPSVMPIRMCSFQQLLQKVWPQLMAVASEGRTSLKHTMHDANLLPAKLKRRRFGIRAAIGYPSLAPCLLYVLQCIYLMQGRYRESHKSVLATMVHHTRHFTASMVCPALSKGIPTAP